MNGQPQGVVPGYMERGSFYGIVIPISIASANGSGTADVLVAGEYDFLMRHIDVALYDAGGAIVEEVVARDKVTINIVDSASGYNWFSGSADAFALRRLSQSEKFIPLLIRAQTEFSVTATHTSRGRNTAPITVQLILMGQKMRKGTIPVRPVL